ncbi:MAG TPA: sensor histidine kinase [Gemmatimonadaceae bacterium]|nr:sensor histidine kinase [Gemmatimonadaceae bacterium]
MDLTADCPLAITLASRLRGSREELTGRWLERISARVTLDPKRVFPTEDLLDHVPLLVDGIADYLENPSQSVAGEPPVIAKAMELGALRHGQGFDEYELLKEYELLGSILFAFLTRTVDDIDEECSRSELLTCAHRVFHAIALIQQATTVRYLQLMRAQLKEREERLRSFNRTLTHELRNRIGAATGAGQVLKIAGIPAPERERLVDVIVRNVDSMHAVLENLLELSRLSADVRQQRHVQLPQAAAEVVRQLREMARAQGVTLRVSEELPVVEVSAAAVELVLSNLVSNAIKYADRAKHGRWVEVRGHVARDADGRAAETVVEVADNGTGVPEAERRQLFERFFRTYDATVTGVEGSGLGLSIVHETVRSLGGRAWAEFPPEGGSVFAFALPCRRADDAEGSPGS